MRNLVPTLAASVVLAVSATACGSSSNEACGPIVHDALDPASATHVLPGAPTPSYAVNPPTSGAHQPGPRITGPVHKPIAPQIQVGILEEGRVLVQYHDISDADVQALEKLDSDRAVVAPATDLPGDSHVVATAWVTHQSCTQVDVDAMKKFIAARAGKGPAQH